MHLTVCNQSAFYLKTCSFLPPYISNETFDFIIFFVALMPKLIVIITMILLF